jgi:hypothetical protein
MLNEQNSIFHFPNIPFLGGAWGGQFYKHMKIVLLSLLCPVVLFAQPGRYTVTGKLHLKTSAVIYFNIVGNGRQKMSDTISVKDGSFTFTGEIDEPKKAVLILDHEKTGQASAQYKPNADKLEVFLTKGTLSITGTDSIVSAKVSGSAKSEEYQQLYGEIIPVENAKRLLIGVPGESDSKEKREKISSGMKTLQEKVKNLQIEHIKSHPDTYVSLYLVSDFANENIMDFELVDSLFAGLTPKIRQTALGKAISGNLKRGGWSLWVL